MGNIDDVLNDVSAINYHSLEVCNVRSVVIPLQGRIAENGGQLQAQ